MNICETIRNDPGLRARAARLLREPDVAFPVLTAKIKLTQACNLRCRFCSVWSSQPAGRPLCLADVEQVLDALARQGLMKIHFSGGEVLLLDWFADAVHCARRLDLQVNLTTNGTLIDKDTARFLVEERVRAVTVSIDSADPGRHDAIRGVKGAWRRTWDGIHRLVARRAKKGRGPVLAVNTVVTRETIDDLDALWQQLVDAGIDRWRLLPVDTEERKSRPTEAQWQSLAARWDGWRGLLSQLPIDWRSARSGARAAKGKYAGVFYGDHPCFAPWFNIFVGSDGAVYPCCMGKTHMPSYGNVRRDTVRELIDGAVRRDVRCGFAAGHAFDVCEKCDDFLEVNEALADLIAEEEEQCGVQ